MRHRATDDYGDGRSVDGYGITVDVLLRNGQSQTSESLYRLATALQSQRQGGYNGDMPTLGKTLLSFAFATSIAACTAQQQQQTKSEVNQAVRSIPTPVKVGAQDAALTAEVAGVMAAQTGVNAFNVKPSAHRRRRHVNG